MIKTCQHCGAVNGDPTDICCFCDAPLGAPGRSPVARRIATRAEGNLAVEPEWRREVSSRLRSYRARRGGVSATLQSALPFDADFESSVQSTGLETEFESPEPAKKSREPRKQSPERFEISISNLDALPVAGQAPWMTSPAASADFQHAHPLSVAPLRDRRRAAIFDAGLLAISYGGMLALFTVLGGHIGLNKLDLVVAGATFALFYAQYFALFTIFGGSTPGMMLRRLHVVSFDGGIPTSRQMAWRSLGYLISAGTCFLGFLWSLWDDDQLCWHDRISHTYLTPNEGIRTY